MGEQNWGKVLPHEMFQDYELWWPIIADTIVVVNTLHYHSIKTLIFLYYSVCYVTIIGWHFSRQYTEEQTVKYLLVLPGNLFSKEADYKNILAPFQSIMHVNLSFNCARPPFKTSLKEYMNWFTLKNCSFKVQKIKCIDHQHFVDYALYSILKLTIETFSFN